MPQQTRKKGGTRFHSAHKLHSSKHRTHHAPYNIHHSSFRKSYKNYLKKKNEAAKPSATARRAAARSQKRNIAQGAMNAASTVSAMPTVSFAAHSRRWHKGPTKPIFPSYQPMTESRSKKILEKAAANQKKEEANARRKAQAAHAVKANELANMFGSLAVSKNEKKNNA